MMMVTIVYCERWWRSGPVVGGSGRSKKLVTNVDLIHDDFMYLSSSSTNIIIIFSLDFKYFRCGVLSAKYEAR